MRVSFGTQVRRAHALIEAARPGAGDDVAVERFLDLPCAGGVLWSHRSSPSVRPAVPGLVAMELL